MTTFKFKKPLFSCICGALGATIAHLTFGRYVAVPEYLSGTFTISEFVTSKNAPDPYFEKSIAEINSNPNLKTFCENLRSFILNDTKFDGVHDVTVYASAPFVAYGWPFASSPCTVNVHCEGKAPPNAHWNEVFTVGATPSLAKMNWSTFVLNWIILSCIVWTSIEIMLWVIRFQ